MKTLMTRLSLVQCWRSSWVASVAYGQGVTTSLPLTDSITDTNGEPLIGANILAVHTPTGSSLWKQHQQWMDSFRIPNMRVGGPYTQLPLAYTGYQDFATGERLSCSWGSPGG